MLNNPIWLILASAYAAAITWALCQWGRPIALRYALMDIPNERKLHSMSTPLIGGLAIVAVVIPIMPVLMLLYDPAGIGNIGLTVLGMATVGCALIGITDDRHSVSATLRLMGTVLLFASAIAIDNRFLITDVRFTGSLPPISLPFWLAWPFTLTVLIGFINAVNMADGKNGLVIGLALCWCTLLSVVGPQGLAVIMLPIAIMLGVLLVFNLQGRIFLGDGGSYGLAGFFGLTSIYCYNIVDPHLTADMLTLFFIVPGLDMIRLVATRIARGQSPMVGDRDHFHHHLLAQFGWPGGLAYYLGMIIVPAALAVRFPDQTFVILMVTMAVFAVTLFVARRVGRVLDDAQGQEQ